MKLFIAVLMMMLGISCAITINHNGQPGCKTDTEMTVKDYRNNWDPTAFWRCETKGQPAKLLRCTMGGWLDSRKACIDWSEWEWVPPVNPPSLP